MITWFGTLQIMMCFGMKFREAFLDRGITFGHLGTVKSCGELGSEKPTGDTVDTSAIW